MIKSEQRWFDFPAALLFLLALWLLGLRLQVTDWTDNLSLVEFAIILAALIGMAIGYSFLSPTTTRWVSIAYSLITLTWLISQIMPDDMVWGEKMLSLFKNTRLSLTEFFRNEPVQGSDLFMVSMIFTFWWISFLAGYQLTRHGKPWLPLGILFIAFLVIDYYPPYVESRYVFSGLMVLFLLLLLGRLFYLHAQLNWKEKRAMVDYGAGLDIARNMVIVGLLLVVVSWGIPGLVRLITPGTKEQQKFVDFWKPLQDRLANAVTDLRSPRTANIDFFGKSLILGTEISEDETIVFRVEVSKQRARGFRYYWRGYSYDAYENGKWLNNIESYETISPSDWPFELPDWEARQRIELTVYWEYVRSRLVYIPSSPLSISRQVNWVGEKIDGGFDGVSIIATTSIYADESYEAESWVTIPTGLQLQTAGEEYPEWVTARYLQLPDDLPERIGQLAEEITSGLVTPLEKTTAITEYLRDTIEYTGKVDQPPADQDPLDWFLFESQKGFCNYYASAEVIMLRSLGIPARLVVGFVQGEKLPDGNIYQVRLKDSHAWPEVFFPGIGWVEFEPTAIRQPPELIFEDLSQIEVDPMARYEGLTENMRDLLEFGRFEDFLEEGVYDENAYLPRFYYPWREWGIFLLVLIIIGMIFWMQVFSGSEIFDRRLPILFENLFRKRGWEVPGWLKFFAYRATLAPIERYFSEISLMLRLIGKYIGPAQTPTEQIDSLLEKLPNAETQALTLLNEYQLSTYSPRQGNLEVARLSHARLWGMVVLAFMKRILQR